MVSFDHYFTVIFLRHFTLSQACFRICHCDIFLVGDTNDVKIHIRNIATGEMLPSSEAPKPDEVDPWLETHPGYEVIDS